jgi:hypothetical protein
VSNWDSGRAPYPYDDTAPDDDGAWFHPVTYDQTVYPDIEPAPAPDEYLGLDDYLAAANETVPDLPRYQGPGPAPGRDPDQEPLDDYAGYDDFRRGPARSWRGSPGRIPFRDIAAAGRPPWRVVAVTAVAAAALGFAVVVATGRVNHSLPPTALPGGTAAPGTPAAGTPAPGTATPATRPPITQAQAQQVLATYTMTNNMANARASQSQLATVETGSSLAIDAGIDQVKKAAGSAPYPAYGPAQASYYIPLEPSDGYPHWFAVQVQNALASAPARVINTEYLIFTQPAPGAPWKNAIEPFILNGSTPPPVAIGANGYATAVTANEAGLALSPATASQATATALDTGAGGPAVPANLADQQALAALRREFPATSSETDRHIAAAEPIYGLRTTGGGALLFYDVAAQLTVTAQGGGTLPLNVPGFLSPGNPAARATLSFLEQFATYDPPGSGAGQGTRGTAPSVVADYSGITGVAR